MIRFALAGIMLTLISGCGKSSYPLAPVSGIVTLDGQPLADARISFQPRRTGSSIESGPGSYAKTDEEGRFRMRTIHGDNGAVVATHDVRISTLQYEEARGEGEGQIIMQEKVPLKYMRNGALTFAVPPEGTTSADFHLTSGNAIK